jgi:hypothetical protein
MATGHPHAVVVLACGGFPHDRQRIAQLMPHAPQGGAALLRCAQGNSGDGLRLGEQAAWSVRHWPGRLGTCIAGTRRWQFRPFPAPDRPRQARLHRRTPRWPALRQRSRLLPRLHERAVRRHAAWRAPEAWLICDHCATPLWHWLGQALSVLYPLLSAQWLFAQRRYPGATGAALGIDAAQLQRTVKASTNMQPKVETLLSARSIGIQPGPGRISKCPTHRCARC